MDNSSSKRFLLTIPYICAQRILYLAREVQVFHMTSTHIARQALHLVILLNDSVDAEKGPNEEQQDERIDLGDELIEPEVAMKQWGTQAERQDAYDARIPDIKQQYAQFFKRRFYFHNARDPENDPVFQKLLAYDSKTAKLGYLPQSISHPSDAEVQTRAESNARVREELNVPAFEANPPLPPLGQRDIVEVASDVMRKANLDDANSLGIELDGFTTAANKLLIAISQPIVPTAAESAKLKPRRNSPPAFMGSRNAKLAPIFIPGGMQGLESDWSDPPRSPSPEGEVHGPSVRIPISDMCFENGKVTHYNIPLDQTFGELADTLIKNDANAALPHFWSKKIDHDQNRVTSSGVTWERQDPSARVLDVIMKKRRNGKKESLGIEKVTKEGEYVVALVEMDGKEGPMPIGIPRSHRQSASKHFQTVVFPGDNVSKVLEMQSGKDASQKIFDRRSFSPFSNPVFIEVRAGSHEQRNFGSKMAGESMPAVAELQ